MGLKSIVLKATIVVALFGASACTTKGVVNGTVDTAGYVTKAAVNGTIGAGKLVVGAVTGGDE